MHAMPLSDRRGPLAARDFRNLYAGQAVSVMGDGLLLVAVAFAVLEIGGGASAIGVVLGANALSLVVFALSQRQRTTSRLAAANRRHTALAGSLLPPAAATPASTV
jgi:hypothetical protein